MEETKKLSAEWLEKSRELEQKAKYARFSESAEIYAEAERAQLVGMLYRENYLTLRRREIFPLTYKILKAYEGKAIGEGRARAIGDETFAAFGGRAYVAQNKVTICDGRDKFEVYGQFFDGNGRLTVPRDGFDDCGKVYESPEATADELLRILAEYNKTKKQLNDLAAAFNADAPAGFELKYLY